MRWLASLCVVISLVGVAGAATPTAHFDSAAAAKEWSFSNGPEFPGAKGSLAFDAQEGHDRPGCLAMQYSFAGGGNYVSATWPIPADNAARLLSVWLKKPAGHVITIRATDAGGQTFQKGIRYEYAGWQHLEVDLNRWDNHWGGANDGKIKWPMRAVGVLIERGEPRDGTLFIDDVELREGTTPPVVELKPDVREVSDELEFSVELTNPGDQPVKGELVWEYASLARRITTHGEKVELPTGKQPVRRTQKLQTGTYNLLDMTIRWIDGSGMTKPVSIGWSRPPEALPGSEKLDPASPIGCGLYLYRWRGNPTAKENMERAADLAQRAGIKWTREEFQWQAIEPQPGKFDFAFYDQILDIERAHGISTYGLLCYWAPWAKANTPEGIEQYCRWAREVVRHYKGRIKHWEIWNEPNIFFWTGPRELYATLLEAAYKAIKAEDPDAVVMGCSTSTIDTKFIQMVMDKGARFDALTIHPYRGALEDMAYIDDLKAAQKLVGGRDVWLTEIGYPSQMVTGWSERRQASLAARTYLLSLASGAVRDVSWYDFRNDGEDRLYNEHNFGIVRSDFRPKPAYRAMATVGRVLAGMRVKETIDVGQGAYAFRFSDGKRDVVSVCAPETGRLFSFETDADVNIVNGVDEALKPSKDGGKLTLTLDAGFPVYISGKAGFAFKSVESPVALVVEPTCVHPGEYVSFPPLSTEPVHKWDLPYGWATPEDKGSGVYVYVLKVPADAPPGEMQVQAEIGDKSPLRLPFTVRVVPVVIRQ